MVRDRDRLNRLPAWVPVALTALPAAVIVVFYAWPLVGLAARLTETG